MPERKSTPLRLIGQGFFTLLPILLVLYVLEKIHLTVEPVVLQALDSFPGVLFTNEWVRAILACLAVLAILLLTGWIAQTARGRRLGKLIESRVLTRVPFYPMLRNLSTGLAGRYDEHSLKPVLVTVNPGMQQFGFIMERHPDGACTVFLPSSRNPGSGTVMLIEAALLHELTTPAHLIFKCQTRWGHGAKAALDESRARPPGPQG